MHFSQCNLVIKLYMTVLGIYFYKFVVLLKSCFKRVAIVCSISFLVKCVCVLCMDKTSKKC